ncbi:MAG: tRNA (adenosine(37)-N6)-dimethylallyltransferase MiaA [Actinomycetes bacterium]
MLGPTASGKTAIAIEVALALGAEVISVDSMQVYRGMDIGTAKPTLEERRGVPHHMIDLVDPAEEFTVAEFAAAGRAIIETASKPLVICGGSGLHFRALVDPMSFAPTDPDLRAELEGLDLDELTERLLAADPDAGAHVDLGNHRRVVRALEIYELTGATPSRRAADPEAERVRRYEARYGFTAFGIDPGEELDDRIRQRQETMWARGLVDEVRDLWPRMGRTARSAVNYRQVGEYLEGRATEEEAYEEALRATRRLARKQRTWFRRDPRVRWIPWDEAAAAERILEAL